MADFVVYHNPGTVGGPVDLRNPNAIFTDKSAKGVRGARVWLMTRDESRPPHYYLCSYFEATDVGPNPSRRFRTKVSGKLKWKAKGTLRIDQEPWFRPLQRAQGNFAFGLNPISTPGVVAALLRLTK